MKAIFITDPEESYIVPLVERFLISELPLVSTTNVEVVVDALTDTLVSTGKIRLAAKPNPESLVKIREIIRWALNENKPIPIVVPSGPKKPGNRIGIDVAELSALRVLDCLDRQVIKHHAPGISVRIRLEDETGFYLEGPEVEPSISSYCWDFVRLAKIMNPRALNPFLESEVSGGRMVALAQEMQNRFFNVITGEASVESLRDLGWSGPLSQALRDELDNRFMRVCPEMDEWERQVHAAKYLANTLARAKLGLTGADDVWSPEGAIFISFAPPTADTPTVSTRLYYRTVPKDHGKLHIPFWRAQGVLRLNDGMIRACVRRWDEQLETVEGSLRLSDGDTSVVLQANVLVD